MKFDFSFEVAGQKVAKSVEMTAEQLRETLQGKIWRSAVVLKNSFNSSIVERVKLDKYIKENASNIDIMRLMTEPAYKKEIVALSESVAVNESECSAKTEIDFLDKAIEKVMAGGGQND